MPPLNLLLSMVFFLFLFGGTGEPSGYPVSPLSPQKEPLPAFMVRTLEGRKIDSRALKGKIVVLNFWFTACKPCVLEIPELNALVESYRADTNVVFLAPALDQAAAITPFLEKHPFAYQVIPDAGNLTRETFGIRSFPTHLIADRNGNIHYRSVGYSSHSANGSTVDGIKNKIRQLLYETAAPSTNASSQ